MVEGDVAAMRQRSNRTALRKALAKCGLHCDDWDAVSIADCQLARKEIEHIVGVAVAQQLAAEGSLATAPCTGGDAAAVGQAAEAAGQPMAADAAATEDESGRAGAAGLGPAVEGASAMERCDSAEAGAGSTAAGMPAAPVLRRHQVAQPPAAAARQQPGDAASPATAGGDRQPSAMQTDEAEAAAAGLAQATAAGPAATTAAGGVAADVAAGEELEGRLQAGAEPAATMGGGGVGAQPGEQGPPPPLWTLRAEHIMAAADAVRKLQQEASAQPEKQALRDVAVDQYEKQLLSEVGLCGAGAACAMPHMFERHRMHCQAPARKERWPAELAFSPPTRMARCWLARCAAALCPLAFMRRRCPAADQVQPRAALPCCCPLR